MSITCALLSVAFGLAAMPITGFIRYVGKKARFLWVNILLDCFSGIFLAGGLVAIGYIFNDGIVKFYMLLFAAAGFTLSCAVKTAFSPGKTKGKREGKGERTDKKRRRRKFV